jgi:hypothetical protein
MSEPKIKMLTAHGVTSYDVFRNHVDFSAYTIAALAVSGMIRVTPSGGVYKPDTKAHPALFRGLVNKTAAKYWTDKERLAEDGSLTVQGLNVVQARLAGKARGYNTNLERVKEFIAAMKAAEPVKLDGYDFSAHVGVMQ